jgi:hypothetical protein
VASSGHLVELIEVVGETSQRKAKTAESHHK